MTVFFLTLPGEKRKKEDYVIFSVVSWDVLSNVVLQEMGVDIFFTSKGGRRDRDRSNHQWEHYYQENHVLFRRWPRRWEHTEVSGCVNCVHPPRSGFRVCSLGEMKTLVKRDANVYQAFQALLAALAKQHTASLPGPNFPSN